MNVFIVPVSDLKYWKISKMPYVDFTAKLKKSEERKNPMMKKRFRNRRPRKIRQNRPLLGKKKGGMNQ